jgi:hypothetical protein
VGLEQRQGGRKERGSSLTEAEIHEMKRESAGTQAKAERSVAETVAPGRNLFQGNQVPRPQVMESEGQRPMPFVFGGTAEDGKETLKRQEKSPAGGRAFRMGGNVT